MMQRAKTLKLSLLRSLMTVANLESQVNSRTRVFQTALFRIIMAISSNRDRVFIAIVKYDRFSKTFRRNDHRRAAVAMGHSPLLLSPWELNYY